MMPLGLVSVALLFAADAKAMLVLSMPEPGGLSELLIGMAGVGYIVWLARKRKS